MKTSSLCINLIVKFASLITLSTSIACSGAELRSIVVTDSAQNIQETVSDVVPAVGVGDAVTEYPAARCF